MPMHEENQGDIQDSRDERWYGQTKEAKHIHPLACYLGKEQQTDRDTETEKQGETDR